MARPLRTIPRNNLPTVAGWPIAGGRLPPFTRQRGNLESLGPTGLYRFRSTATVGPTYRALPRAKERPGLWAQGEFLSWTANILLVVNR